jgi:glycosyltransferase involved in cell wall biosynthesis
MRAEDFIIDAPTPPAPAAMPVVAPPVRANRSLGVVIPLLNEVKGLPALVQRATATLDRLGRPWEVVVVDDGSTDGTREALRALNARDPRWRAISLSRNFGKEIAVAAGLREASGDAVVIMDGDLQHPPETIAEFVRRWDEGFEVVYGTRRDRDMDGPVRRLLSCAFYGLFKRLSGTELPPGAGDFRLLDRRAVDALNRMGERARFNKGLYAWIGFRSTGVPFDVAARRDGASRWRLGRLLAFAVDGFASFTTIPLRIWSYVGLLVSGLAFLYAVVFLAKTLIYGIDQPGFPTQIISIMILGGVQLISLGVIGEYLARVYEEVKGRPLYIVAERIGEPERPAAPAATPPAEKA